MYKHRTAMHSHTHTRSVCVLNLSGVTDTGTNHTCIIHDMREYPVVSLKCNVIISTKRAAWKWATASNFHTPILANWFARCLPIYASAVQEKKQQQQQVKSLKLNVKRQKRFIRKETKLTWASIEQRQQDERERKRERERGRSASKTLSLQQHEMDL